MVVNLQEHWMILGSWQKKHTMGLLTMVLL